MLRWTGDEIELPRCLGSDFPQAVRLGPLNINCVRIASAIRSLSAKSCKIFNSGEWRTMSNTFRPGHNLDPKFNRRLLFIRGNSQFKYTA